MFAQAKKNKIVVTGSRTISVQKSGCNPTKITTTDIIHKKGRNHFFKSLKLWLYFFKAAAKKIIRETFRNSVGCIKKGIQGIDIHHLAHFKAAQTIKT